ncbi:MAG: TIGR03618 family F420-dependent PPOX class oxidoreductase [Chloroflexota bacterium]|nr:TIGR03618 family F420-dependent PPOX class oxidoreductase [Chloroflexota bacterium]
MPQIQVLGTVLGPEIRSWLVAELRFPVLAVVGRDGAPSQSAMWFDLDPGQPDTIIMNTRPERLKARLIRADPRVSLCFVDGYEWVALRGRAEIEDDLERGSRTIEQLALRYGKDPGRYAGQSRVTVVMHVEKVIRYS